VELTSKFLQVPVFELNKTLHTSRAMKNNRRIFLYVPLKLGPNARSGSLGGKKGGLESWDKNFLR